MKINRTEEEARGRKCCTMDKLCEASDCMAWEIATSFQYNVTVHNFESIPTDKGYCGLIKER